MTCLIDKMEHLSTLIYNNHEVSTEMENYISYIIDDLKNLKRDMLRTFDQHSAKSSEGHDCRLIRSILEDFL